MQKNKMLNEEELVKVDGGLIDDDSVRWINKNASVILKRAIDLGLKNEQRELIADMLGDDELYTIEDLKKRLKEIGVDCDDLM